MLDDQFLLRATGEHFFYYRQGHGIIIERGPGAELSEESLWLNGSVYAAVASMNGLVPVHASAVVHENRVFAFSGPTGAGKSTLTAALGDRGMPMLSDDMLVLDLSGEQVMCLPGHKRLKLAEQAFDLTRATPQEPVSSTFGKRYAVPTAGTADAALPLGVLIFLEEGRVPRIEPIVGADRFLRMQDDHQTAHLFAGASKMDRETRFAHRAGLARDIRMARFVRPHDIAAFDDGVAVAADYITGFTRD